jgi:GxxExxY protein
MKLPENLAAAAVVDVAVKVHKTLGPGLLETVYETAVAFELVKRGHSVDRQKSIPLVIEGVAFPSAYRVDLLVDNCLVVEIKSLDSLANVYHKQVMTYCRLGGFRLGLLLNFNVAMMKEGIRRIAMEMPDEPGPLADSGSSTLASA